MCSAMASARKGPGRTLCRAPSIRAFLRGREARPARRCREPRSPGLRALPGRRAADPGHPGALRSRQACHLGRRRLGRPPPGLRAQASVERGAARRGDQPPPAGRHAARGDPDHGRHSRDVASVRRPVLATVGFTGLARRPPGRRGPRHGAPGCDGRPAASAGAACPRMTDVLVVGSGPGGVNAAARLVEAGRRVTILDYGNRDDHYAGLIPRQPFTELRRADPEQHRYLLGEHFEGIPFGPVRVGAQLTPPRMHILADAAARQPVDAPGFAASMSLARGGLGAGWSAGVFPFSDDELADMGLSVAELQPHYDAVAERIGVAGNDADLERFLPRSPSIMPGLEMDSNAETVWARYQRKRGPLNAEGFYLGQTRLAVCTRAHRGRGAYDYLDLDYWADKDRSVYRPQWTLDELLGQPNFTYLDRRFVHGFTEVDERVVVEADEVDSRTAER